MIVLTRSQSSDIRIFLNLSLILAIGIIALSFAVQPDRQINAEYTFHSFTAFGMKKYTYNWTVSKEYVYFWAFNDFWLHLGYMYLDFWTFDIIHERRDNFYYRILALVVSWVRLFTTWAVIHVLSESWTWGEMLELDSIMIERLFRYIAAILEALLLMQLIFVKVIVQHRD